MLDKLLVLRDNPRWLWGMVMIAGRVLSALDAMMEVRNLSAAPLPQMPPTSENEDHPGLLGEPLGYAEGQTFMIEYKDSRGETSRRLITVWGVVPGAGGVPTLMAKCHIRKTTRQFRVDRIVEVIDLHGEVHEDVNGFLQDTIGISPAYTQKASAKRGNEWAGMLECARPYAQVLAALSDVDGFMHKDEIEIAAAFCADVCGRAGLMAAEAEEMAFRRYLKNMRPDRDMVVRAVDRIAERDERVIISFLRCAKDVVEADGKRHPLEVAFLDELAMALTGVHIS